MAQTKKMVFGTQRALDKEVEARKAKGWEVAGTEAVPRGKRCRRMFYIAYFTKSNKDKD